MRASRRSQPYSINTQFQCQLCHATAGHAFLLAVCITMLPMLIVAAERAHLAATDHMNSMDQQYIYPRHTTFKHAPFMLPSLNNILPAMALQNEVVKSNIWCLSRSSSHTSVCHVSFRPGFNVPSGLGRMVVGAVMVLLLLMSGDIEMNPGPVGNMLTSDDLGCVLEGVLDAAAQWYNLGLKLNVSTATLDSIQEDFTATQHCLREMLKAWLNTGDNPSWKTLIDALKSPLVGASQLTAVLEVQYSPIKRTESDIGGHSETDIIPPSEPVHRVILQQTVMQESMRAFPSLPPFPIIDKTTSPEPQAATGIIHTSLQHQHTQGPQCTPELKVFNLYCNKLVESISHPERLAFELHSQEMISTQVCDETMKITGPSMYCRASKLLAAVKDQITKNPSVMRKFLSVIIWDPSLVYIADAMSDHYRSFLPPKGADTSLLTLNQLSAELRDFENWYLLGLQLNISKDTLDSIERRYNTGVRCCIEMVQHWIINSENPSWDTIHEVLRNIGESVIAEKIAFKFNIQPSITREEKFPAQSLEYPTSRSEETKSNKELKPRQTIPREQARICGYFAVVMDRITEIVASSVEKDKLLQFLHFYGHPLNPEMCYIDQQILQSTSSVSEVMKFLFPDCINYMNTGLLEDIVVRFECKEAERLLQQYRDRYPLNRLLRDMPDPVSDERLDLTRCKRLRVKCDGDFDSARALDIKRIRTSVEDATGIDQQFVTHAQHSEGFLKLIFLIPESVVNVFQELCDEDLEILAEAGIVELQIDDFVISVIKKYCPQRAESSTRCITAPSVGQSSTAAKGFDSYIDQRAEHFTSKEESQLKGLLKTISKSMMEEVCSDSFLRQLATHMRDWRKLAPHFSITQHEAEVLAFSYPDVGEQRYRALHCWKQINSNNATYKKLIACLLTHAPFDLAEAALKMTSPEDAVQKTRKLLQEAYLSEESVPLWTGAPKLLQFDRRLGRVTGNTDERLRDIDYSSRLETMHFSSKIATVSIKSFVNGIAIAKEKNHPVFIKGPPGSGKTVLLRRVCAFWARGFCLRKFTLVLWLDLKAHPSGSLNLPLRTLLSYSLPRDSHLGSIRQWLERQGTQDILIVVDGVEGQAYNKWTLFLEWLAGTKASVILTATSPVKIKDPTTYGASYMILCQYDMLGLSQDQISKQVIHHYGHDPSRAEEFLMYISEAHEIRALCSSPPYLVAVLFVFDSVSTTDLPNTWTQLFSSLKNSLFRLTSVSESVDTNPHKWTKWFFSLKHSLFRQSGVPDTNLASKAYMATITNSTFDWDHDYTNFCSRVTPPYHTMISTAEHCYFTLPLLQYYLCAQHIHSLPHRQRVSALNEKTVPLHMRLFYVGLCSSSKRAKVVLTNKDTFMYAACESEVAINELQKIMTSELTFNNQLLTSFDIHHIFQAVHYSGLMCKLEFSQCLFGSLTFEMMAKWLTAYSILPNGGVIQKLSLEWNQISNIGACELAGALRMNHSLQKLDLSGNLISNIGARELAGALQMNHSLKKLDLGNNYISAEGVNAVAAALQVNHSLQELNLRGNLIEKGVCALSEALRVNQSLQKLNLGSNQISDEGAHAVAAALQVNHSLQELNLRSNQISDEGAHAVAAALQVNHSLQELNLRRNKISAEGVCALVRVFQVNQSLQKLKLCGLSKDEITDEYVCALVRGLQVNPSHWKLDLSNKRITDKGACTLSAALQVNQSLQELNLSENKISNIGALDLAGALQVNHSLQELDLSGNQIKEEGVRALSEALQVNHSLQRLNLRGNKISNIGARELAGVLQENHSLQKLDLSGNQIKEEGVRVLSEALRMNQSLQKLNLCENQISNIGARELAGALQVNHTLQELDLIDNQIKEGVCVLSEALQVNQSLQDLNLGSNEISDKGARELAAMLQVNQSLQELNLSGNRLKEGVRALSEALRVNQSLQKLNLWNNNISDEGARELAAALQVNQSLQELNLSRNRISDEGAHVLGEALRVNQSLQKLNIGWNHISSRGCSALKEVQLRRKNLEIKGLDRTFQRC